MWLVTLVEEGKIVEVWIASEVLGHAQVVSRVLTLEQLEELHFLLCSE